MPAYVLPDQRMPPVSKLNWIHQFRDREDVTKSRKNFLVDNGFVLEEVAPFVACV